VSHLSSKPDESGLSLPTKLAPPKTTANKTHVSDTANGTTQP